MNNKDRAIDFLRMCSAGYVREAFDKYIAADFVHHNPYFAGDAASLMRGMIENAERFPGKIFAVQRALSDGDLVAVHSQVRMNPQHSGVAVVHILRFADNHPPENGRIVELWDVGQPLPESSPNLHGMF